jgi:hypothetical protein
MARKSWSELSPAYQKRLRNKGIGPREHAAGASIQAARGHTKTPEHNIWRKKAIAMDIRMIVPGYDKLPTGEQERIGRDWVNGFMSRAKGKPENIRITDWRYGRKGFERGTKMRYQTDDQLNAHIEFLSWTQNPANQQYLHDPKGQQEDWQQYRIEYQQKFSKG